MGGVFRKNTNLRLVYSSHMNRQRTTAFKYRARLKKKATRHEKIVKRILLSLGIDFEFQRIFFGKKRFVIADFFIRSHGVVIEIDGKDHYKEDRLIYDEYRTQFLKNRCKVLDVIRYKNEEVVKERDRIENELAERFCERPKDAFSEAFFATI